VRLVFDLRRAHSCSGGHARAARAMIMDAASLRSGAVHAEYTKYFGGDLVAAFERFDRGLALARRGASTR
jgi:hypothetical protein